jgi:hypothetical protein
VKAATLAGIGLLFLGLACDSTVDDSVPPTVSWISPAQGDTLDPGVVTLVARARDDRNVKWVVFLLRSDLLGFVRPDGSDTFRLAVDLGADTAHLCELAASAEDQARNSTTARLGVFVRR